MNTSVKLQIIDADIVTDPTSTKNELILKAGLCLRGEIADELDRENVLALVCKLEEGMSIPASVIPAMCIGNW